MKNIVKDCLKVFLIGLVSGLVLSLVFFLIGLLTGGGSVAAGIEACKSGLLVLVSAGLFIITGMLLTHGRKAERFVGNESWRKHFHVIGYKSAIAIFCIVIIALAVVADLIVTAM